MKDALLRTISPEEIPLVRRGPVDSDSLAVARPIVEDVRQRGETALREHAERLGDIGPNGQLYFTPDELEAELEALPGDERQLLERTAQRIRAFAVAQRKSIKPIEIAVPGGRAGQTIAPVERAGCYAPGGRFPLPSSVLMTAITARVAGVEEIWVASPKPAKATLAAAALAGAKGLLAAGGAQAIAALAYGAGPVSSCDVVVGPGNRFVTAAKQLVAGSVAIDMLAGPSELVVLADGSADARLVACDLLAQAEHDPCAVPILVTADRQVVSAVNTELQRQLADLPSRENVRAALGNGFAVVASNLDAAIEVCDRLAPEHLELMVDDADAVALRVRHYGALFVGAGSAQVLGDYGAGPNHTLPTGGAARHTGGLSVLNFLRVRTWLKIDDPESAMPLVRDAEGLALIEGLGGHACSARMRAQSR